MKGTECLALECCDPLITIGVLKGQDGNLLILLSLLDPDDVVEAEMNLFFSVRRIPPQFF